MALTEHAHGAECIALAVCAQQDNMSGARGTHSSGTRGTLAHAAHTVLAQRVGVVTLTDLKALALQKQWHELI